MACPASSDSGESCTKSRVTERGIEMELDQKVEIATGIDSLAQVTVQVGINLKPGQQLIVLSPDGGVPIETLPLVRRVTEHAYRAGASLVTTLYADDFSNALQISPWE
jgi:leucyl aminopeptidase (aminopeptidase T)